jgi:hypothetical protein
MTSVRPEQEQKSPSFSSAYALGIILLDISPDESGAPACSPRNTGSITRTVALSTWKYDSVVIPAPASCRRSRPT